MSLKFKTLGKLLYCKNGACLYARLFSSAKETHFGFENVSEEEKGNRVHEVFSRVADKYDLMNDVMSGGIHRLWKDHYVRSIGPVDGAFLLDVAGGTGDIAFRYLDHIKNNRKPKDFPSASEASKDECKDKKPLVTVFDINQSMLDVGRSRAEKNGHSQDIAWQLGDAEKLPFQPDSFDVYTVAYGIRNMTHIEDALAEAHRVLRKGGMFACLEFSRVNNYFLRSLYNSYSFNVIPVMGKLVAGDFNSYKYLVESIRQFPDQEEFSHMIRDVGFKGVRYENLLCGVSAIHTAFKL